MFFYLLRFCSFYSLYTNENGHGPAWANSLFEDFCEFGLGMELANEKMRARLVKVMEEAIAADCTPAEVKELFR